MQISLTRLLEIQSYVRGMGYAARIREGAVIIGCPGQLYIEGEYVRCVDEYSVTTMQHAIRLVESMP